MHVNNFILILYVVSNQMNMFCYENMRNDFVFYSRVWEDCRLNRFCGCRNHILAEYLPEKRKYRMDISNKKVDFGILTTKVSSKYLVILSGILEIFSKHCYLCMCYYLNKVVCQLVNIDIAYGKYPSY